MSEPLSSTVALADLALAFRRRGLLDRRSARSLPACTTTLIRRAVRRLPRELRHAIERDVPPPSRGDAIRYAEPLLEALDAASAVDLDDVPAWIEDVGHALDPLIAVSRRPTSVDAEQLRAAFVAGGVSNLVFRPAADDDWEQALHLAVRLAGEGIMATGPAASQAAFCLSLRVAEKRDVPGLKHNLELAFTWCSDEDDSFATWLRSLNARIAAVSGRADRAVELAAPIVARLDGPEDPGSGIAIELCQSLAQAHLSRHEHELSIERAGYAAWRSTRDNGEHHPHTRDAYEVLADMLGSAGRFPEAVSVLEQHMADRYAELDDEPHATLNAAGKLAAGYFRAGRVDNAVTLARRVVAEGEQRLDAADPMLEQLRELLARIEEGGREHP